MKNEERAVCGAGTRGPDGGGVVLSAADQRDDSAHLQAQLATRLVPDPPSHGGELIPAKNKMLWHCCYTEITALASMLQLLLFR